MGMSWGWPGDLSEYLILIPSFDGLDFFDTLLEEDFLVAPFELAGMMLAFTKNKKLTVLYQMELIW